MNNGEPTGEEPAPPDDLEQESRGGPTPATLPVSTRAGRRNRRQAAAGKTKARNLHLTDDVHDRLFLYARQRKIPLSAAANDLLDKALPHYKVERVG